MSQHNSPMSNPQLAELLGISPTYASRVRHGKRHPSPDTMVAIRKAFKWSVDDQVDAIRSGKFSAELERRIIIHTKMKVNS